MTNKKIPLEEAQCFILWFYEKYHIVLGTSEARLLMEGDTFRRLNKYSWRKKEHEV